MPLILSFGGGNTGLRGRADFRRFHLVVGVRAGFGGARNYDGLILSLDSPSVRLFLPTVLDFCLSPVVFRVTPFPTATQRVMGVPRSPPPIPPRSLFRSLGTPSTAPIVSDHPDRSRPLNFSRHTQPLGRPEAFNPAPSSSGLFLISWPVQEACSCNLALSVPARTSASGTRSLRQRPTSTRPMTFFFLPPLLERAFSWLRLACAPPRRRAKFHSRRP